VKKITLVAVALAACTFTFTAAVKNDGTAANSRVLTNDGGAPPPLCDPFQNPNCKLPGGQ
jgi:hypothetical protein